MLVVFVIDFFIIKIMFK